MNGTPLKTISDLDPLIDAIGDARYVLLGEASHGTHEFYHWRAELSKRLISERQFSFVAVEGDWPDCYRVNRFVKGFSEAGESAEEVLHAFERWPTWMWANRDVVEFIDWLHEYNQSRPVEEKTGFYGLDVYSLWESMAAVVEYVERIDPALARATRRAYLCFEPYQGDAQAYAHATAFVPLSCESEAITVLQTLRHKSAEYQKDGREAHYNAEQNAWVVRGAETYYRTMMRGGPTSWNVRDHHMMDTLDRLMSYHGDSGKAIVWAHNTHIGDARFTNMKSHGMVNIGQLVRQTHERDGVVLVGFGAYRGTVIAGEEWGAPMQRMRVPEARAGSLEDVLHRATGGRDMLLLSDESSDWGIPELGQMLGHRAIGVVYDPEVEQWGNYVPTILPRRYDAFLFLNEMRGVDPLHMPVLVDGEVPETYPTGM